MKGFMKTFVANRGQSLSMVVLVLLIVGVLQGSISYSATFGALDNFIPGIKEDGPAADLWLGLQALFLLIPLLFWILNRKRLLFKAIIIATGVFTFSLFLNLVALLDVLVNVSTQATETLLLDVFLMAISNILLFSIWYWLIDPPGLDEIPRDNEPCDFLFPQRGGVIAGHESWVPRYTDYLYLAFTTSFAFSPTDTLPLTRRAKMLMLSQSAMSIITLTGIAGGAIGKLAGGS